MYARKTTAIGNGTGRNSGRADAMVTAPVANAHVAGHAAVRHLLRCGIHLAVGHPGMFGVGLRRRRNRTVLARQSTHGRHAEPGAEKHREHGQGSECQTE